MIIGARIVKTGIAVTITMYICQALNLEPALFGAVSAVINELIPARLERRAKSGAPPVSSEFQAILDLLESGCPTVARVNGKLRALLCDGADVEPEEITETYWEKLTAAIEQWQPRLTDSYYLHALLEVAVVANEIRWVAREGKKLLKPEQGNLPNVCS
ncbi:MAG: aromatic acid exporter family protein [Bacillota bacterium]